MKGKNYKNYEISMIEPSVPLMRFWRQFNRRILHRITFPKHRRVVLLGLIIFLVLILKFGTRPLYTELPVEALLDSPDLFLTGQDISKSKILETFKKFGFEDASGEYSILDDFTDKVRGDFSSSSSSSALILVTQCSITNLHHLVTLKRRWAGRAEVTVFAPGFHDILSAIQIVESLQKCFPRTRITTTTTTTTTTTFPTR